MRFSNLLCILAILLFLHDACASLGQDPKLGLALRERPHQRRRYDTWQSLLAPDGWKISYITFEHFIPIQVAAAGLQQLYLTLAVSAFASQYGSLAPSNAVVLRLGSLNLTMWSNEKISWAVVQAFAARMWALTDMGFTPGYSLTFVGPSGIELRVSLQVRGMVMRDVEESRSRVRNPKRWPMVSSSRKHSDLDVL